MNYVHKKHSLLYIIQYKRDMVRDIGVLLKILTKLLFHWSRDAQMPYQSASLRLGYSTANPVPVNASVKQQIEFLASSMKA